MTYSDLWLLLVPEAIITATALFVLGIDVTLRKAALERRIKAAVSLATLGAFGAGAWLIASCPTGRFLDGMLAVDQLTQGVKIVLLLLLVFTAWVTTALPFTHHPGEYCALLLFATLGMMLVVSTENLLMLFVSLELLSLCLYILAGFDKRALRSAEAGLKYFLIGSLSTAMMLYGFSLVYGLSGELNLTRAAGKLAAAFPDPLLLIACAMIMAGFGFKVAAAPFHLWAPDAYQGAPVASAAFIASGSKVAGFFILGKVLLVGLAGVAGATAWQDFRAGWAPLIAGMAVLSLIIGNVAAIAQSSVRRLLAYSAVAQAGYMFVGLLAGTPAGFASVLFYVITYALTALGAFAVVSVVQTQRGDDRIAAFAGLAREAPWLSFCMLVFLLSLAGIPPLAGFFGKFYLFAAALSQGANLGLLWLVALAIAMSAVSLYYYLQVLKQIYVMPPPEANDSAPGKPPRVVSAIILVSAAAVILFGCLPHLLLNPILAALKQ